jgi:hypothetical protein
MAHSDILPPVNGVGFPSETRYDIKILNNKVYIFVTKLYYTEGHAEIQASEILTSAFQYGMQVVSMN